MERTERCLADRTKYFQLPAAFDLPNYWYF
jgi:hypothetical protein